MEEKKKYLLKGDISGIQEFIFNVQSKGAAKTLKARSYYVQIVGFLACEFILKNLPISQKFYEGGGSFFIEFVVDDDEMATKKVNELQEKLNKFQQEEELLIRLSYMKIKAGAFNKAWLALRSQSFEDKLKFFEDNLGFFTPFAKIDNNRANEQFPEVKQWIKNKTGLKDDNSIYKSLTEVMVKRESIWIKNFDGEFIAAEAKFDGSLINKLPFWKSYMELERYRSYRKTQPNFYSGDIDLNNDNIIDFDALGEFAAHRTGTNKIGILKLDVDNLGKLFATATEGDAKSYSNIFSRFFTRTIYENLFVTKEFGLNETTEKYSSNIYPIFSGGDDCFIIGGWDAILCFAQDLHELFINDSEIKKIKIGDKPVTFSAGVILVNPTHPVRDFAELAEEALSKAKGDGKDHISLFGLTFSWGGYKHILKTSKLLSEEMKLRNISRSYLDKIRKSARGFNALQNKDGADFDKIYKLKYYLSKNDKKLDGVVDLLFEPYFEELKAKLLENKERQKYDVAIYPAIARITEFLTKQRLEYETI